MAENRKREDRAAYSLKRSSVEDLAASHTGRTKAYSEQELRKYRTRKGITLAKWLKIVLLKMWFAGVVCYFILWGLGIYLSATLDILIVAGVALGLVNDLLLNSLLRFMEEREGENKCWMFFSGKTYISLPLNILYSFAVLMCVYQVYVGINSAAAAVSGSADTVALGVEPILFGLLYAGFDLLFLGIKYMAGRIVKDARAKVDMNK